MRVPSWLRRPKFALDEEDFTEEIRAHLAIAREEKTQDGLDGSEAHYAALREFGNVTRTIEAARRVWMPPWLETCRDVTSDIRYGARSLVRKAGFSFAVISVLALGIGLNAAVFTMLKSIALTPLAGVERAAGLAVVHAATDAGRPVRLSYPDYRHLRDHNEAFASLAGSVVVKANLGRGRGARQVWGEFVTGNYFEVLGVSAARGRTLQPSDEVAAGRHPVVVISDGLWRRDFAADPAIIGTLIEINNSPFTIVGVAEPAFHGTTVVYDVELFVPVMMAPALGFMFGSGATTAEGVLADPNAATFYPFGYLRPAMTLTAAAAHVEALWPTRPSAAPAGRKPITRAQVVPFLQAPNGAPSYIMPTLVVLSIMALLVLAVACANLAGLVLVRGVSRRGEMAVRLALGATTPRLVRLLVVENLLLALPGALLGVLLARTGIPLLVQYAERMAAPLRVHFNTEVDALVVGFAVLTACGSVLLFGFIPALRSARVNLVSTINEDASPRAASRGRVRSGLVVAQVGVSVLLLVGAGLAARSVNAALRANPGFDVDGTTAVSFDLRQNAYDEARGRLFYRRLLDAAAGDATIASASIAVATPLNMTETRAERITIDGYAPREEQDLAFMSNVVGPDYFRTLQVSLLAGREFERGDDERAEPVTIVNRTLAQRFLGGPANAVGQRIRVADGPWRTVVGVVADLKYLQIDEAPRPYFYLSILQAHRSSVVFHTRGSASIDRLVENARSHVARLDPELPILGARSMRQATRGALIFLDLTAMMLLLFAIAGVMLAAMGTYGLVAYAVQQSTREIGIRIALGATAAAIVSQFLLRGLRLGGLGAAIGLIAALGGSRLLAAVLFGVSPIDGVTLLGAVGLVLASVATAALVPAWRAGGARPLDILRHQ